jgi:hypothetical protein
MTVRPMTRTRKCTLALVILAAGWAGPASAQVARLHPVDEAVGQHDLWSFRAQLIQAAARRDTASLFAALAPDVLNSFGGDGGVAEFSDKWRPAEPGSDVWRTLVQVLSLGGTFHGDSLFIAPYTHTRFPSEFDPFDHVVVVGANVRVRAQPNPNAEILKTASFDVFPMAHGLPVASGWQAVVLEDGRHGFIHKLHVLSPTAYRVGLVRRGGRWLIRFLIAGD